MNTQEPEELEDALNSAIINGDIKEVKSLIKCGASVDRFTDVTPLYIAALYNRAEIAEYLIAAGARVDGIAGGDHQTPLHIASFYGHLKTVKLLIKNKANVNARGNYGTTPLHEAARGNKAAVIKLLLDNGAYSHIKNDSGETPLMCAVFFKCKKAIKILSDAPAATQEEKNELLVQAVIRGDIEEVKSLIKDGADVNSGEGGSKYGYKPLHYTAYNDHVAIAEVLIEAGADINATVFGVAPLQWAVHYKSKQVTDLLLEAGADVTIEDVTGTSALDEALHTGQFDLLGRLRKIKNHKKN